MSGSGKGIVNSVRPPKVTTGGHGKGDANQRQYNQRDDVTTAHEAAKLARAPCRAHYDHRQHTD